MRSARWFPRKAVPTSTKITAAALALMLSQALHAQTGPAPVTLPIAAACAPAPAALVKRRAMTGDQPAPAPSADELAAYRAYVQYQQANDWADRCRYADENRLVTARPHVVLIGDSVTEFWKQRDPQFFTDAILDRGISGQTTPQLLVRFYQDVVALRPRVVHIMAGTNDIAGNTGPTSDAQFRDAIMAMVDLARANGIRVILASIPPAKAFPWRLDLRPGARIGAWNEWLRGYAHAHGMVFVDYHAALADAEGGMKPGLSVDGVHPSHAGYQLMDARFRHALAAAERRSAPALR